MTFLTLILLLNTFRTLVSLTVNTQLLSVYHHYVTLDENNKFWLYWSVDNDTISFAMHVDNPGWIGTMLPITNTKNIIKNKQTKMRIPPSFCEIAQKKTKKKSNWDFPKQFNDIK